MTNRTSPRTANLQLRRARQAMHLSQAEFADAVRAAGSALGAPNHCTKRLVQKWEAGEHTVCRPDYLRVLQAVTGLAVHELGFRVEPVEAPAVSPSDFAMAAGSAQGEAGRTSVPAALPSAASLAEQPKAPSSARAAEGLGRLSASLGAVSGASYSSDAMTEDAMGRLRYALEHPQTVDTRTAELVESATARLFDLEHHSPARLLAPTLDRHLATVTGLLTAARHEAVRRRLLVSAGQTAVLAGWVAFDRNDTPTANRFWDTAIGIAEGAMEGPLLACGLTYLSYSAERRGDAATAWQLAHTAGWHCMDDHRASSWAAAREALHAAQIGEEAEALFALEKSLELGMDLPKPKPGDGGKAWTRFFDRARLLSSTARTAALLGDPRAADFAAQSVSALGKARVKSRAVILAEAAVTAALCDEFERCLDYGSSAAGLARELDASVAIELLEYVVTVLMPHADARPVRELLPQLANLRKYSALDIE